MAKAKSIYTYLLLSSFFFLTMADPTRSEPT